MQRNCSVLWLSDRIWLQDCSLESGIPGRKQKRAGGLCQNYFSQSPAARRLFDLTEPSE